MVWICLFIPLCVWLGIAVLSPLNVYTLGGVGITVLIYLIIELRQVSRYKGRSRYPLWIMALMLFSVILGLVW